VYDVGCRDFGENKVQELIEKQAQLPKDIIWHMIGHLQRNKVKYIIDKVKYIHSVDSFRLAEEISKQAKKKNCVMNILLEVNISREETKFGILVEEIELIYNEILKLSNLKICGLMTIAPHTINPEENRQYFHKLKQVLVDIQEKNIDNTNMSEFSMGMSGDYLIAIEEGATFVRVGTGIFGVRDYSKQE
jgi:pyridoxal phosphate enzyme (YggS family)